MHKTILLAAGLAAGAALAACDRNGNLTGANDNGGQLASTTASYCAPFRTTRVNQVNTAQVDPGGAFEECLHRWAYTLAPARDPADTVAKAAVDACAVDLARWNQQALAQGGGQAGGQGTSLTTGEPTDQMTAHAQYAQGRALFYVVQARAGKCGPPPLSNGQMAAK